MHVRTDRLNQRFSAVVVQRIRGAVGNVLHRGIIRAGMTTSNPPAQTPPTPVWRWAVLLAISAAMFGNYYAYDSVGPVADSLQRLLGYTDTQIGTLNAIYSFPNIVMVLVGGVIVDRFGTRLATLMFSFVCALGAILTALSPLFPVMAAGRLLFGLGAESMIVAITVAIGQWFVGQIGRAHV